MPISSGCSQSTVSTFNFKWIPAGIKYLGIRLCSDLENIVSISIASLIKKMKANLDKWKLINLTLWGKINIIKMVIGPQFNYISRMISVNISDGIFKQYNWLIREFLWNGKKPRIGLKKLFASRESVGLGLPNMELYNIAFEINKIARHWANYESNPRWVMMEGALAAPSGVVELLSQKNTAKQTEEGNLILQHSQWAWARAHTILVISQYKQNYSSICNNPSICIGKRVFLWNTWLTKEIHVVNYLYRETLRLFMSFGDFWKYFQLRSSIGLVFGLERGEEEENKFQEFLNSPHIIHSASIFYRKMLNSQTRLCEGLRLIWQKDLGSEIREELWQDIISNAGWATRDARSKFIHYKTVHKYYFTPLKWA